MKKIILLSLLHLICLNTSAQEVLKETHLYSVKGSDSLRLDRYYTPVCEETKELKPVIIFMFGGAFYTGTRDEVRFIPCFEYYAQRGYEVFSIDYRLGLKGVKLNSIKPASALIKTINNTLNIAVEDLYDATTYIAERSEEWQVDTSMVITFGSSAGAISILQAEYYLVNKHTLSAKLPSGFRYKGVISMAGAIFSMNGKLKWGSDVAPMLMLQGSADRNVPYGSKRIFKYGFFGSKAIAKSLKKIKSPYYFCTFEGAGHEIALSPMNDNREDIDAFLDKLVIEKQPLEIVKISTNTSKGRVKDRFSMRDYINANFK